MYSAPGTVSEVRHYPSPRLIRVGDVFMMQDDHYTKDPEVSDSRIGTHIIRYSRPCIILSYTNTVLTVIPMTTKHHNFNCNYELKTAFDKQSFAILDQVTTIDFTRLSNRMGYLKLEVFMDLRGEYIRNISTLPATGSGAKRITTAKAIRHVPFPRYDDLDMVSFLPWTIYKEKDKPNPFLAVELINREFIALPINDYTPESALHISIPDLPFTASVDLTDIKFMGDEFYIGKEYDLLGYIIDPSVIKAITGVLTSMYSFRVIRGPQLDEYPLLLNRTQREMLGILRPNLDLDTYTSILRFIRNIPTSPSIWSAVLREDFRNELIARFSMKLIDPIISSTYMYWDIVKACLENMNFLDMQLEQLQYLQNTFPEEFEKRVIRDYVPCLSTKNPGFVFENAMNRRIGRPIYRSENAKYLAEYIIERSLDK